MDTYLFFLIVKIILGVFFTYRVSQFLSLDEGPFLVFDRIRHYTDIKRADEQDKEKIGFWTTFDGIIRCQYCTSVYVGFIATALVFSSNKLLFIVLVWGGIIGLHAFLLDVLDFRGLRG